jgi:hypothetical protein
MMMKYLTAAEALAITNEAIQYSKQGNALKDVLESVVENAQAQRKDCICEGVGALVDFQGLITALTQLGYTVQDISATTTPRGSHYLPRSLKISW